jgi:hypothetical protein
MVPCGLELPDQPAVDVGRMRMTSAHHNNGMWRQGFPKHLPSIGA